MTTGCVGSRQPDTTGGHTIQTPMAQPPTRRAGTMVSPLTATSTTAEAPLLRGIHPTLPPAAVAVVLHQPAVGTTSIAHLPGKTLFYSATPSLNSSPGTTPLVLSPLDLMITLLPERTHPTDHPTPAIGMLTPQTPNPWLTSRTGAAPRVLLLVLVLVLTIQDTQVALAGLRTLVVVLPLDIQAAMAIQAVTLLQGALAVLETILLVPLVITQNQATEGCKKCAVHTWHATVVTCACLSHPNVTPSRLCNTHHLISAIQHPTLCQMCGFLVSWLHLLLLPHTPSPQFHYICRISCLLILFYTFSLCFTPLESTLPSFLCSSVASPPHTQYIVAIPAPGCLQTRRWYLVDLCLYCAGSASTERIVRSCLACDSELYEEC